MALSSKLRIAEDQRPAAASVLTLVGPDLARAVWRTANVLLANAAEAEEVSLDVLDVLHERFVALRGEALDEWVQTLPGRLDRAAVGKAKGRAHKRKRHSSELTELKILSEQLAATQTREMAEAQLVRELMAYLPRRHRFVYLLAFGLGHPPEAIADLVGLEPSTVQRTLAAVEQKLGEYAAHHEIPAALLALMREPAPERHPLRSYVEAFGVADERTLERIEERFASHLERDPDQLELTGDFTVSDYELTGVNFDRAAVLDGPDASEDEAAVAVPSLESDAGADPVVVPERGWAGWVFATVAAVGVVVCSIALMKMSDRLAAVEGSLRTMAEGVRGPTEAKTAGPVLLEPGEFLDLEHDSRAEPAKDATVELLRSDASGAEFRLEDGSIALHLKRPEGVEWLVHDGAYDIAAAEGSSRFRVSHTGAVPKVEVFEGAVEVRGGLLGAAGVRVDTGNASLATAMRARGEVPLAGELEAKTPAPPYPPGDPEGAVDEVYARALALRAHDELAAAKLLREIVDRGEEDWVSELAFNQLRTLVAADARVELQQAYEERFPAGHFAEPFAAIACQAIDEDEDAAAAQECWTEFALTYPQSLYGP